jgi:glycogen phosphorylase
LSNDDEAISSLSELALDMRSAWNHQADKIWRQLDSDLWELTHNPWVVLQTVSRDKIGQLLTIPEFRQVVDQLVEARRSAAAAPAWFQQVHPKAPLRCVAYFSMEFMLSEALPIYSGGLGNVAGDQLKTASDLGVPVTGIGLLYQQGYFRQIIDADGAQQALFPFNDPGQLPISPLRESNGEWLRIRLDLPGYPIWLRVWQVQVGRLKLYLLDSNDAANFAPYRGITSELYGGDAWLRLMQELVLGIGGWRLLMDLGLEPEIAHLNEGHAAFAVLERARWFMRKAGQSFETALAITRAGNLFTTHTAVAAGFDRFHSSLIERYLAKYAQQQLGITVADLLALGRQNSNDSTEDFNMAWLAIRGCGAVNAVSRLHGDVSRRLFAPLFPRWPELEVPVDHVTNGVHMPTWDSAAADEMWTEACGKSRWLGEIETLESGMRRVSDAMLWEFRNETRAMLVHYARERLFNQLAASGATPDAVEAARHLFDPNTLTLGFARRFASYKRPNLLLYDKDRLIRLLTNSQFPMQLIIAGKAHPEDRDGQELIREWTKFVRRPEVRTHAVFLSDYDMLLTARLVQGVDVWLNTPRRPWEACGTSGMKVLVNGGINLSELDGWWAEAYTPEIGWALGDGREHGDDPARDAIDAEILYDLLEHQVIPEFYTRNENDIPVRWVGRMRESIARLTPRFSTNRSVREYTEKYYVPLASSYRRRAAKNGAVGAGIVDWKRGLDRNWGDLAIGNVRVTAVDSQRRFEADIHLGRLDPSALRVELYADGSNGGAPVRQSMAPLDGNQGATGIIVYVAEVPAARASSEYTVRIIPYGDEISVPLENSLILWQK